MPRLSVFKGEKRHSLSVSRSRAVVSPLSLLCHVSRPPRPLPSRATYRSGAAVASGSGYYQ